MKIVNRRTGVVRDTDTPEDPVVAANRRALAEHRRLCEQAAETDRLTSAVRAKLGITGPGSGRHAKQGRRGGRHRSD